MGMLRRRILPESAAAAASAHPPTAPAVGMLRRPLWGCCAGESCPSRPLLLPGAPGLAGTPSARRTRTGATRTDLSRSGRKTPRKHKADGSAPGFLVRVIMRRREACQRLGPLWTPVGAPCLGEGLCDKQAEATRAVKPRLGRQLRPARRMAEPADANRSRRFADLKMFLVFFLKLAFFILKK